MIVKKKSFSDFFKTFVSFVCDFFVRLYNFLWVKHTDRLVVFSLFWGFVGICYWLFHTPESVKIERQKVFAEKALYAEKLEKNLNEGSIEKIESIKGGSGGNSGREFEKYRTIGYDFVYKIYLKNGSFFYANGNTVCGIGEISGFQYRLKYVSSSLTGKYFTLECLPKVE